MSSELIKTMEVAHGRWREILPQLGVPIDSLNGKNIPCPSCGGTDRFRYHDRNGDGDYYCNGCGAGKGISLVMKVNGWTYAETAKRIDEIIGNLPKEAPAWEGQKKVDTRVVAMELWKNSSPISPGDPAWLYLYSRGLKPTSGELRYVEGLFHSDTQSNHPGMIARVCDADGKGQTLHRTYLTKEGKKANVEQCRKLMPGEFPKGGAVRLGEPEEKLGIAEGIETALSASVIFGFPVWAAISEGLLQQWQPPSVAKHIVVFGDSDRNYVGQNAAYALAKRLSLENRDLQVDVVITETLGCDWNDILLRMPRHRSGDQKTDVVKGMVNASAA